MQYAVGGMEKHVMTGEKNKISVTGIENININIDSINIISPIQESTYMLRQTIVFIITPLGHAHIYKVLNTFF